MKSISIFLLFTLVIPNVYSQSTCSRVVDSENFSNPQVFTQVGTQNFTITGGKAQWDHAICGTYDHQYRNLNDTLSNNYFRAEFQFKVLPNPQNHGSGAVLLAFTSGIEDFQCYDANGNYLSTTQDGIGVLLNSSTISNNNINMWSLLLTTKEDSIRAVGTSSISLSSTITDYYMIFERLSDTIVNMSLYTDSLQTTLIGQSTNTVSANILDLYVMQLGTSTSGWFTRQFNGTLDNIIICDNLDQVGLPENLLQSFLSINGTITSENGFSVHSEYNGEIELLVYDLTGKQIAQKSIFAGENNLESRWSPGMYLLNFRNKEGISFQRKIVVY